MCTCVIYTVCRRESKIICGAVGTVSASTDQNPEVCVDLNISFSATGMPVVIGVSPDR